MELTSKRQDKILKKANLPKNRMYFTAVITETVHPESAIEVNHKGETYWVTLTHGDFVSIYLK